MFKFKPSVEVLEAREVPANFLWSYTGAGIGDSDVAANWQTIGDVGRNVPDSTDTLVLSQGTGNINLKLNQVHEIVTTENWNKEIVRDGNLLLTGNSFFISGTMILNGRLDVGDGGVLTFGTIMVPQEQNERIFHLYTPNHTVSSLTINSSAELKIRHLVTDFSIENYGTWTHQIGSSLNLNNEFAKLSNYGTWNVKDGVTKLNFNLASTSRSVVDNYGTMNVFDTCKHEFDFGIKNSGTLNLGVSSTLKVNSPLWINWTNPGGSNDDYSFSLLNYGQLEMKSGSKVESDSNVLSSGFGNAIKVDTSGGIAKFTGMSVYIQHGSLVSFVNGGNSTLQIDDERKIFFFDGGSLSLSANIGNSTIDKIKGGGISLNNTGTVTIAALNVPENVPQVNLAFIDVVNTPINNDDFANYVLPNGFVKERGEANNRYKFWITPGLNEVTVGI